MHLIAKVIRISHAKFHCNRFTTVQVITNDASLIFWHTLYIVNVKMRVLKCCCDLIIAVSHNECLRSTAVHSVQDKVLIEILMMCFTVCLLQKLKAIANMSC